MNKTEIIRKNKLTEMSADFLPFRYSEGGIGKRA